MIRVPDEFKQEFEKRYNITLVRNNTHMQIVTESDEPGDKPRIVPIPPSWAVLGVCRMSLASGITRTKMLCGITGLTYEDPVKYFDMLLKYMDINIATQKAKALSSTPKTDMYFVYPLALIISNKNVLSNYIIKRKGWDYKRQQALEKLRKGDK
jgi:hypothetical protein